MGPYLKAAFLARVPVPGLGQLPLNALAVAAFGILGFVVPWLWLLGLGLETLFLFGLASNRSFRNLVDGRQLQASAQADAVRRLDQMRALPVELQQRLIELRRRSQKVIEVSEHAGDFDADNNKEALLRLESVYLKLLIAKNNLAAVAAGNSAPLLTAQIQDTQAHVDSDLMKVEVQVELLLGNAAIQSKPDTTITDIELESFGLIAGLDQALARPRIQAGESA